MKKKITFYFITLIFLFILINIFCYFTIQIVTKKNIYSNEYKEFKIRFKKSGDKSTYPHPFFGFGVRQNFSLENSINNEPLFVNKVKIEENSKYVNILILGGSVAKHLSINNSNDIFKYQNTQIDHEEIFEKTINSYFQTNKFKVYNASIDGGKQPQQLFKLYYLDLLDVKFDVIINLDGFNELALTLSENYLINDHLIYPRNFSRLISTFNSSFDCLDDLNNRVSRFSYLPITELYDLYKIRNCHFYLEGESKNVGTRFSRITKYKKEDFDKAITNTKKIWKISSEKIQTFSNSKNIIYMHILQPNQYLKSSKIFTKKERNLMNYEKYGNIISKYYADLKFESLNVKNKADLRYMFLKNKNEVYRDYCCHLNNYGMHEISKEIIKNFEYEFKLLLN